MILIYNILFHGWKRNIIDGLFQFDAISNIQKAISYLFNVTNIPLQASSKWTNFVLKKLIA